MDWMERVHGVYSYVVEVVPPLEDNRWCEDAEDACWSEVDVHADTAALWLDSIVGEHNGELQDNGDVNQDPFIIIEPKPEEPAGLSGASNTTGAIDSSENRNITSTVLLSLGLGVLAVLGVIFYFRKRRLTSLRRYRIDYCTPPNLPIRSPTTTQLPSEPSIPSAISSWGAAPDAPGRTCSELTVAQP